MKKRKAEKRERLVSLGSEPGCVVSACASHGATISQPVMPDRARDRFGPAVRDRIEAARRPNEQVIDRLLQKVRRPHGLE